MTYSFRNALLLVFSVVVIACAATLIHFDYGFIAGLVLGWPAYSFAADLSKMLGWHDD